MKLFKEIYELLIDIIKDARSTRERLIWISLGVFIFSVIKGVDVVTLGIVAGWMTTIVGFYFYAKHTEHKHKHEKELQESVNVIAPVHDPDKE